jgi:predicted lactoylglutathione lyase
MTKALFLNLPVGDIAAATRFYEAIGCSRNAQFSDEKASSMVWADNITFHLLHRDYFAGFSPRPAADARAAAQMLVALTVASRAEVDDLAARAAAAGGAADPRAPMDLGWLYNRAFEDVDGHLFEAVWVDAAAMPGDGG